MARKTIVIGIGNPFLSDDSVGIKVAQAFEGIVDTEVVMATDLKVIDKIIGYERAIIVDGIKSGTEPGTIFELSVDELFSGYHFCGTHNLSLPATLKIGYEIFGEEMPREIKIIGIEVEDINTRSEKCTPKVEAAITQAIETVKKYIC